MKRGFTLIELLAVIVILAIIALIAVPIVLNIINDSKESSLLRSAEFYLDAVEYTIADAFLYHGGLNDGTYPITPEGDICKEDETPCQDKNILKVEVNGDKPTGGSITINNGNIRDVELILDEKTIVKNSNGELVYNTKPCKYTEDEDGYEMVTCGTESFYIMEKTEDSITMFAQYNLNIGNNPYPNGTIGIQNENVVGYKEGYTKYGEVGFSSNDYWFNYDNIPEYTVDSNYAREGRMYPYVYGDYKDASENQQNIIYPYVESYEEYLKENGVSSASATLMSYEQALDLRQNQGNPNWLYNTSYLLGSITTYYVHAIRSDGLFSTVMYDGGGGPIGDFPDATFDYSGFLGVRPVIIVSTSEIQ